MRVTRRFWGVAGGGAVLAGLAALAGTPTPLFGAVGVGAWLFARQYAFVSALRRVHADLSITQDLDPDRAATEETTRLTLQAHVAGGSPLPVTVESTPPLAADGGRASAALAVGEATATDAATVSVSIAGRHRFDAPSARVYSRFGLFVEDLACGEATALTVHPRTLRNVHVGVSGKRVAAAYGQHSVEEGGSGLDPAEIREYVPGDPARSIDWNATARLGGPYVREFEAESDRYTVLLVDHGTHMTTGAEGETQLDYVRDVALTLVDAADQREDPLGLYTVGDEGVTSIYEPAATTQHYNRVRDRLRNLRPTSGGDGEAAAPGGRSAAERTAGSPAAARRIAAVLANEESDFADRLRPFVAAADSYVQRIDDRPLFAAVRTYLTRLQGRQLGILLTDDSDRTSVRETIKLLRRGDNRAFAILAPDALYGSEGATDLDAAYRRYADFEDFRRDLASLDRVRALEVAPGDRVAAVLAAGREQRSRRRASGRGQRQRQGQDPARDERTPDDDAADRRGERP
jgi:uncharacterized protein (DUF58 family)